MSDETARPGQLSRGLLLTMAIASGLAVANLYYSQPLLVQIGRDFAVSDRQVGILPSMAQLGYAAGLFLLVPLGDMLERRRLIITLFALVTVFLLIAARAPTFGVLAAATFAIGLTTIMAQLLLPFAAHLCEPGQRGKVVGSIMSGLLIGILLSRTASGFVGGKWGWRAMYEIAAGLMLALAVLLRLLLPRSRPAMAIAYGDLMRSILALAREQPVLREAALSGAGVFAAFSIFWATLVFFLSSPAYHLGAPAAGLFGLVGAAGALAAPLAGRFADRGSARSLVRWATLLILAAYIVFWGCGRHLWGLIIGVILLDVSVQAAHVSNQTRVFSLLPAARSRVNTVYMVSYFIGGSLGSYGGALAWSLGQWRGVCLLGIGLAVALLLYLRS